MKPMLTLWKQNKYDQMCPGLFTKSWTFWLCFSENSKKKNYKDLKCSSWEVENYVYRCWQHIRTNTNFACLVLNKFFPLNANFGSNFIPKVWLIPSSTNTLFEIWCWKAQNMPASTSAEKGSINRTLNLQLRVLSDFTHLLACKDHIYGRNVQPKDIVKSVITMAI